MKKLIYSAVAALSVQEERITSLAFVKMKRQSISLKIERAVMRNSLKV